ncbi:digestive cysteine ase 1 [Paramuricea clavata]|uniref:Digestive cysteine ase 1 n=1 Tax=Paramuricea clavata TaxID=317549 RepID=A0A6S7JB39_PARCT|nr:digestive cysteine ase 1 [Paramuricea clavata]
MQWILKHGGLARENNYGKYLAQEGYCHFKNVSIGVRVDSYMNIGKENATELKQAIAQYGPISVLINTQPKSFKFYSSGIYYDPECSGSNLDHAALAVGYGAERGIPYWLIKNSWSKAWGESGYIKIAQRNDNCGVTSKAVVVRIK